MGVNIYYLELMFILINVSQQQKLRFYFEEKRQEAFKKHLVVNLLKLIRVMQKIVIIQIMRLVMQKHLLMSLKKNKTKELEEKIKEEEESNKKIKELEDKIREEQKSKFAKELLSCVQHFYASKTHQIFC